MDDIVDRLSDVTDRDRISDAQEEILALRNKVADQQAEIDLIRAEVLEEAARVVLEEREKDFPDFRTAVAAIRALKDGN
jgi:hypothetical protein